MIGIASVVSVGEIKESMVLPVDMLQISE